MNQRVNKKGESSTITIIIAIVLGVAVLVFLIFGFSSGWNNLWDRVSNLGGGKSNLATIVSACDLACSTASTADYCTTKRTVKFGEAVDTYYISGGEGTQASPYVTNDDSKDKSSAIGTCYQFAEKENLGDKFFKVEGSTTNPAAAARLTLKFPGLTVAKCPNLC